MKSRLIELVGESDNRDRDFDGDIVETSPEMMFVTCL